MKKQSAYWRKREREGVIRIDPQIWAKTVLNCTPNDEVPPLPVKVESVGAEQVVHHLRANLSALKSSSGTVDDFNDLATELGKASARSVEIAGMDSATNPMIAIIRAGNDALRSCLSRYKRWDKWQVTLAEGGTLEAALELHETILQSSSPAQMRLALAKRKEALRLKRRDEKKAIG